MAENKLEEWRSAMEDRGLNINRMKMVYLRFNVDGTLDGNSAINLQGQNLERVNILNTGMDKTSLYTSSGSLFVRDSICPRHVERNYVPLFGVQTAWHNRTSTYVIP